MDKTMSGKFSGKQASAGDLERGYSLDGSAIPNDGESVFKPEHEEMEKKYRMYMEEEEKFGEGGFIDRDECGHKRY